VSGRRPVSPREVEALAAECGKLLRWLESTAGSTATVDEFTRTLSAYNALQRAITLLPRGREVLRRAIALPKIWRPEPVHDNRNGEDIGADEVAMLRVPLLTQTGWVVPEPFGLAKRVDRVRAELRGQGRADSDTAALDTMLRSLARCTGRSEVRAMREGLPSNKTRLSRERRQAAAITAGTAKVPPEDAPA